MTARFIFTCGCETNGQAIRPGIRIARACPNHPKRSLREVVIQCEACGVNVTFKPGVYQVRSIKMCREHKTIYLRYMNWLQKVTREEPGREIMGWPEYLASYNERNGNRFKQGPRR